LQVGHWKNSELPDELEKIRGNSGASSRGIAEWEVNLAIAEAAKEILEDEGFVVDILPATIPPSYWADAFIAIHADGSTSPATNGFKVAASQRDYTGNASELVGIIEEEYKDTVGFPKDPNITRNMRGYYAFSWWRYEHSLHPMTPSVILETGFLTNSKEASLLINEPDIPAKAIANALLKFLK
jgi:N-acetylmuramoyl-L-alanine amidase